MCRKYIKLVFVYSCFITYISYHRYCSIVSFFTFQQSWIFAHVRTSNIIVINVDSETSLPELEYQLCQLYDFGQII